MPLPKITEEIKDDLQVGHIRSALDSKLFYKKNNIEAHRHARKFKENIN